MRARALLGVASVVAVVVMLWASVTPAQACVPGTVETWVAQSQQIVVGRFVSWEIAGQAKVVKHDDLWATRHRIQVLETLRGNVQKNGTYSWGFSPSECPPTLEKDPTGRSAIIGVVPPDNGFIFFFLGDDASGPEYDRVLERLAYAGVMSLPIGGGAPSGGDFPPMLAVALAVVGPLASLAGAAFLVAARRTSQRMRNGKRMPMRGVVATLVPSRPQDERGGV